MLNSFSLMTVARGLYTCDVFTFPGCDLAVSRSKIPHILDNLLQKISPCAAGFAM